MSPRTPPFARARLVTALSCAALGVALTLTAASPVAQAAPARGKRAEPTESKNAPAQAPVPATAGLSVKDAPQIAAKSWLVHDMTSGTLLAASDPDAKTEPASLTKLMTAYLAFNAIKERKLSLDARPPVSPAAHKAIGSRMFVDPASPATVNELLHGLIIQSGNDAAIILAETLGGSEDGFVQQMNREAKRLGLNNTQFTNASGLPDARHYSTARDLATLATRLIEDHPDFYKLYSQRDYTYNNIKQPNRNRLLFIDPTVDGVKTGRTDAAGYCLIASSSRLQPGTDTPRRLVSVVLGASSETARAIESQKLLNYGFSGFDLVKLYGKDQAAASYPVFKGQSREVKAGFSTPVLATVPKGQGDKIRGEIERVQPLIAPIAKGQRIGTLRVQLGEQTLAEHPLLALEAIEEAGWFGKAWDTIRLWFK